MTDSGVPGSNAVDALLGSAEARLFVLCCAVLAAKLLVLSAYAALVARRRGDRHGGANADERADELVGESLLERRVASARREDLESFALFFGIGILFLLCGGASSLSSQLLFAPFVIASIFHTWCVLAGLRRWRVVNRAIAGICLAGMTAHLFVALMR